MELHRFSKALVCFVFVIAACSSEGPPVASLGKIELNTGGTPLPDAGTQLPDSGTTPCDAGTCQCGTAGQTSCSEDAQCCEGLVCDPDGHTCCAPSGAPCPYAPQGAGCCGGELTCGQTGACQ